MATHLGSCTTGAPSRSVHLLQRQERAAKRGGWARVRVRASSSYLEMWKKAVERERKTSNFNRIAASSDGTVDHDDLQKKTNEFQKLLQVSTEERDRVQRMQVIDRAAAAIAAARAILKDTNNSNDAHSNSSTHQEHDNLVGSGSGSGSGMQSGSVLVPESGTQRDGVPGPDFWSWTPPLDGDVPSNDANGLQLDTKSSVYSTLPNPVVEKERSLQSLSIPFESLLSQSTHNPTLPPFQSSLDVEASASKLESPSLEEEETRGALSSGHAAEAVRALDKANKSSPMGVNPDGSRWWKETGVERRPDGVLCRWTLNRGVSADKAIEWQEKFWEAADDFGYKELGSEKSGRDANGNVWREFWRESMRQENGLLHFEKTADKWGSNGKGNEWQEKWWEHYNASGQAEKWAHKWCSIDPNTPLEPGHAHVWHE
ncbi:RNA polymerase II transcription elongation factor DSIF/SUPT5H/SPT5, partial [Sesbania bispinosa]